MTRPLTLAEIRAAIETALDGLSRAELRGLAAELLARADATPTPHLRVIRGGRGRDPDPVRRARRKVAR